MKKILLIILTVLSIGCKKEQEQPKPYVVSGNFSFSYNNSNYDLNGNATSGNVVFCELIQKNNKTYLRIIGNKMNGVLAKVVLDIQIKMPSNSVSLGSYSTNGDVDNYIEYQTQYDSRCYCMYHFKTNSTNIATVNVTKYNAERKEVDVTFFGTLKRENHTSTVSVTNGRVFGNMP